MRTTSLRKWLAVAAALLLLAALPLPSARASEAPTVTVACIDYNDFLVPQPDGSYSGFAADYLQRIASYTGWKYEYVFMDWPTAYETARTGAVDFYCVARQTEARQQEFDFSLYPVCNEEMNLYALPGSVAYYEDYAAFNGMRIGMLQNSGEIDYFRQYALERGFVYELTEYPLNEDAVQALYRGEVDAIALVNYSVSDGLKLIGNFGVSPAYMMSCEGSRYMEQFSEAQERLYFDDPTYAQELEKRYFGDARPSSGLLLTRAEAEYIAASDTLTVAVSPDMAPIEYYDGTSAFRGLTVDLYEKIADMTGLSFRYVRRGDSPELIAQMERGEVQLVGALARNADVAKALRITQTTAFAESSMTLVAKDMTALNADSVAAVPAGYPQFKATANQEGYPNVREFAGFEACVDAVYSGKADLTYIISMCESHLLDHVRYTALRSLACAHTTYGISLGVSNVCDARLLSILNKCIAVISSREVNELLVANTAKAAPEQTFADYMAKNGAALLVIGLIIAALAAFGFVRSQKVKQQQTLNQKLRQQSDFLQHMYNTLPCGVFQYAYEPPHAILSASAACAKIYGVGDVSEMVGRTPLDVVKDSTGNAFEEKFRLCEESNAPILYVWPITRGDGSEGYTECVMELVETERGKVFQEAFIDVTERVLTEQQTERRYLRELSRNGDDAMHTACVDVTQQTLVSANVDAPDVRIGMSADAFAAGLLADMIEPSDTAQRAELRARLTAPRMERAYEDGEFEQQLLFCRRKEAGFQWLRADLTLRVNPANGHLMCFTYVQDVTDEQVTGEIVRRMAYADCDGIACIYAPTSICMQYGINVEKPAHSNAVYGENDEITRMAAHMSDQDAQTFLRDTSLDVVMSKLAESKHYQVFATLTEAGERHDKALTYFALDREAGILAVSAADVTQVRADEVRHARLLSDALAAAEKADAAKSQFLSRVSHEMRTPLNAIIGFIELAKGADAEKTAEYLASSDIAAKQLLNVINDVLDMSSIESGKLKIAKSAFSFKQMIASITNLFGAQCRQKGLLYETRLTTPVDDWLIGDELRVNQVLMNLLGNAVKFTSEGRVRLTITQTEVNADRPFIRFEVSDTGCGMSDEMQERLFRPFEQENAAVARRFGGSGLGLSIVKSLVTMMGGVVRVESTQGAGSVFTVDLPFEHSDIGCGSGMPRRAETLHVLAVDDEATEREYIGLVLARMGVRYACVESGGVALEELERAEEAGDPYNVCIVDCRMPDISGVETTRRIRARYGEDVVVLVTSAYDYQQAGSAAREAGANLFLSKPVFQSALFDLLTGLTGGQAALPEDEPQTWDFTGKRVLLAEDNRLNQIVAKGYLAKFHATVDVAANGQQAAELFAASPDGYYDAILMDIQMPVLDGLEATRVIRRSGHPQAATIPIIAQTADAFNEDIARALSAGMNAHVSKPIQPDRLAKALYQAFTQTKEK